MRYFWGRLAERYRARRYARRFTREEAARRLASLDVPLRVPLVW